LKEFLKGSEKVGQSGYETRVHDAN